MSERFTYIGSVYLFLVKDDKILLQRRYQTGFEDGNYGVPSGHMDGSETAREASVREIREEISITIEPSDLKVVHVSHRKASMDERIDFFMTTAQYQGDIKNCEPEKCDDLEWFALSDLPENMVQYVKTALMLYLNGDTYSEYGW